MWCTFDAKDVIDNLANDPPWGWVHKSGEAWHTVSGTLLLGQPALAGPPITAGDLRADNDGGVPGPQPIVIQLRAR